MNRVKSLKQRLIARDWDEAVLHHNSTEVPATWLHKDHKFELMEDDYLLISTDQSVLPTSRAQAQAAGKQAQADKKDFSQKDYDNLLKETNGEFWIDLNQVVMFEFHQTKHIKTPKSMIIAP